MTQIHANGQHQTIDGVDKVYYDGYWIKYYEPPEDNLTDKKRLIQSLTRRLFNHMEHGINIPGRVLEQVRAAYEAKVPMGRGCSPADVARAILYLVEQSYETGQALPVTGGQIMLS